LLQFFFHLCLRQFRRFRIVVSDHLSLMPPHIPTAHNRVQHQSGTSKKTQNDYYSRKIFSHCTASPLTFPREPGRPAPAGNASCSAFTYPTTLWRRPVPGHRRGAFVIGIKPLCTNQTYRLSFVTVLLLRLFSSWR